MKTKSFILGIAALAFIATTASAQSAESVKIMKTETPGVIKLHYALEKTEPLFVKFITDQKGVVCSDKIKGEYPNGISKRYDVRSINNEDFWLEISNPKMELTYRIKTSKDGKSFDAILEKTTYNQVLVRANN